MSTPKTAPYKRLQRATEALLKTAHTLEPTVGQRMRRMPPHEQQEIRDIMQRLQLRKSVRFTLSQAHLNKPAAAPPASSSTVNYAAIVK